MKRAFSGRIWILLAIFLGALVWLYDSLLDAFIFYQAPFLDMLILRVPARELAVRASVWIALLGLGWMISRHTSLQSRRGAALRESTQMLMLLLDGVQADIYVGDLESYEILFTNRHMRESFGGDLVGQVCYRALRNETQPCGHCPNSQFLDEKGEPRGVIVWEGVNPLTGRWYLFHDHAIRWVDGRYVRLQLAVDITLIKKAEAALIERSANLEREVEARTRQLAESQARLLRAEKLAALGKIAGGIAHDLRNPLAVISNAAYMLATTLEQGDRVDREYVQLIQREVGRSGEIIEALLQFSRQSPPTRERVNLKWCVQEVLERCPSPPGVIVDQAAGNWERTILFDRAQLQQVLANLIINAYEAMESAPRHPGQQGHCLRLTPREANGAFELCIEDTGPGIPEENLDRIFEPLFTTKKRGTGMGLTIAHGLVEANGGSLRAESVQGSGARFVLTLPIAGQETAAIHAGAGRSSMVEDGQNAMA